MRARNSSRAEASSTATTATPSDRIDLPKNTFLPATTGKSTTDEDFFTDVSVRDFVVALRQERDDLAENYDSPDEPFVLVHGDFHGRNILTRGDRILAIIDWEFAGSYPLSETLAGVDVDVVEANSEELDDENTTWNRKIREAIRQEVARRGWEPSRVALLMGDGNLELGRARGEMVP